MICTSPHCVFSTCCTLNRAIGVPGTDCWTGTGDTGLMNTMPLCCRASEPSGAQSGVWGAGKAETGLELEIRPRFCRVKLRMAGLGLWRRWGCWMACGEEEEAGLWKRRLMGVTSWAKAGLEPGEDKIIKTRV